MADNLWRDRFPVLGPEDHAELEGAAAVHELGEGMPRHAAEERAHRAWLGRQLTRAAAHHLAGTRAAHAAGNRADATRHATMYAVSMRALGHPVVGEPPPDIAALARDQVATPVYRFSSHPADGVLLDGLKASKGKPLGKAEAPIAGAPVDMPPDGTTVWDMSHLLPQVRRDAGLRLHVRHGAEMEGHLFQESAGRRVPVATYGERDGKAAPWQASRPTEPDEDAAAQRAFAMRRLATRAATAAAGRHVAGLIDQARRGLG